ncbi:DUF2779 domain-containing protein [Leptospira kanakyensis]|uniref:DUF2779 domain-containing protein n=1 Tax=Leptospira kanakyensis TaxID=2484968 RepID=A0A6N4Q059_9LEPT|nr:DUF2779 domain-containing protein [Leptospira kanakyensis]TGK47601.1 DUF2779 domain-containing protein [Leptospira kanakyensis]TGK63395.1 DUF2779 domain-containing protein [Leptospira kanakyensis]TGK66999.1 DUF2779 domain-containing protein [Leptospira kanakyensis]
MFDPSLTPVTKSQYLQFLRCTNAFHLVRQGLVPKPSTSSFGGHLEWGEFLQLCKNQFPESQTIERTMEREESFQKTSEWIAEKKSIFHAHLRMGQFVSTVEYLEYDSEREGWILWDFRPIGSLKQDILRSFYFHKKIAEGMSLKLVAFKLIRIQTKYIYPGGQIQPEDYLLIEDITPRMDAELGTRESEWEQFQKEIDKTTEQSVQFSFLDSKPSCRSLKTCLSPTHCAKGKENAKEIFDFRDSSELAKGWFALGYNSYESVPNSELSPIQRIQKEAHITGKTYFDRTNFENYLTNVTKTVAFLDFESINPYLPLYPQTRPFQHVPYLYSLHIWDSEKDLLTHKTYLHEDLGTDPRVSVLNQLQKDLPPGITIFSFNDFFEKLIIQETALAFPEFLEFWEGVKSMFIDLAMPFKKLWIYHPGQNGKASLKEILPCFSSESHLGLSIREGQDANYQYLRLIKKQVTAEEKKRVLEDLIAYCKLDSYGLFIIYRMLQERLSVI